MLAQHAALLYLGHLVECLRIDRCTSGLRPLARMTQALAVFLRRCCLVPIIERRLTNAEVQVIEVPAHDLAPRLDDDRVGDPHKRGSQPSYHLKSKG